MGRSDDYKASSINWFFDCGIVDGIVGRQTCAEFALALAATDIHMSEEQDFKARFPDEYISKYNTRPNGHPFDKYDPPPPTLLLISWLAF